MYIIYMYMYVHVYTCTCVHIQYMYYYIHVHVHNDTYNMQYVHVHVPSWGWKSHQGTTSANLKRPLTSFLFPWPRAGIRLLLLDNLNHTHTHTHTGPLSQVIPRSRWVATAHCANTFLYTLRGADVHAVRAHRLEPRFLVWYLAMSYDIREC